ncbi:hypothetical protein ACU4GD_43575 [Cupriavidus basilensis]
MLEIQAQCYRGMLLESGAALASRLTLSPATCWAAARAGQNETLAAYLFTHMWPQDSLPPLDGVLEPHWERSDESRRAAALTWFVHDMAVAPAGQGKGLAQGLYVAARGGGAGRRGCARRGWSPCNRQHRGGADSGTKKLPRPTTHPTPSCRPMAPTPC